MKQLIPKHFADRKLPSIEEGDHVIELVRVEVLESGEGLLMHTTITRCQKANLAWTLQVGRVVLVSETPRGDPESETRVDLAEMPRELPDRASLGIGAKIVLVSWKCLQKAYDSFCF